MTIIYQSNTGFTQAYAEMLGKAAHRKVCHWDEALTRLDQGSPVLYMGPLMAGHVSGLDKARKRFQVLAVCGVGMAPPGPEVMASMQWANYVGEAPLFYLRGGWAPKKVGWLKRRMVFMAARSMADETFLKQGGSFVAYQNLAPLENWLEKQP